ncbi:DUF4192 domain-containing protein [Rhodococcus sp. HNM0569]|uniref:DUF4192 domain-containing protein n=1 Tax=Rhodococcus sp. HNM0569 TaxID=2716340 RepID=UPI00146D953E|nr:DUF4192 domain-containing protein [Rhodococcus sp. HNM0569]NLU81400.1 DUF4192 domain-containing protein [Rhodococcus sp. HNM0569]
MTFPLEPAPSGDPALPAIRLSDPGELISSLPALLGFRPERSFVVLTLGPGSGLGIVMRYDLDVDPAAPGRLSRATVHTLARFAEVAADHDARGVVVVVVDDRAGCARFPGDTPVSDPGPLQLTAEAMVAAFETMLDPEAIDVCDAFVTPGVHAGSPWHSVFDPARRGSQPDPAGSRVAVARVVGGYAIHGSRDELEALVAPADVSVVEQVRLHIAARTHTAVDPAAALRALVERIAAESGSPSAEDCATTVVALRDRRVRDAVVALAVGTLASHAERYWLEATRLAPAAERADVAALAGFSAYVRGDGPLAGVAFSAALDADPGHRLAGLLDASLRHALRPDAVAGLADVGFDVARRLGVALPPPRARAAT